MPAPPRPPTAPPAAPSPQPAAPAATAATASPSLNLFASPLAETISAISMGPLGQSPDVFADLESPAICATSPAAAPAAQQQRSHAPPASVGSTGMGASISSKLSRLMRRGWAKSPAAGSSTKSAGGQATAGGGESVCAALDAVDAGRTGGWMGGQLGELAHGSCLPALTARWLCYSTNGVHTARTDHTRSPCLLLQPPCCVCRPQRGMKLLLQVRLQRPSARSMGLPLPRWTWQTPWGHARAAPL